MSHALYRKGTPRNLRNDFVVMAGVAKGRNEAGAAAKARRFFDIARRHHPVNMGEITMGSAHQIDLDQIGQRLDWDTPLVHAVFTDAETVAALLRQLQEADLGLCITVSGLFEPVREYCRQAGLTPYGIEESLGILGRTDLLPAEPVVEIGTMCGHGLVSFRLIEMLAQQIREGETTTADAARELARQCVCGIFNPVRAQSLLEGMTAE